MEKKKISFMGLVETKHKKSVRSRMKRLWGNDDYDICESYASESNGGGMIAVWDKQTFVATNILMGSRWILIEGRMNMLNFECCVGVIYGHNDRARRSAMFEEIKQRVGNINKPILIIGDFNVTLHAGERSGPFRCNQSMHEFSEWVTELSLLDLPLHGLKYTWSRNESKSRIDRALCCHAWLRSFPHMRLQGLKRSFSDHNTLLISMEESSNWGPKPFRCFDAWFLNPKFKGFLVDEWRNIPNMPLHNKLKAIKSPIKAWRSANFDQMDNKIADFEAVIHDLEQKSDHRMLDNMEKARLNAANSSLHQWLIRRERIWRQRARSYGFKLKDHNTKFFQASTLYKRKKKEICQLCNDPS